MKNIAASVRARLANQAREAGVSLPSLIERFAIGRLLWRLSQNEASDRFILKGAQLFSLWSGELHRPTRDLDLLGFGDLSEEQVGAFFQELLAAPADPDDGIVWRDLTYGPIRKDQRYGGTRVNAIVVLDGAKVPLQIDIGFGDAVTPGAVEHTWRGLLDFPEARLLAYPPETVIAEKLEAAVELGINNSRMKDFYDLDWLAKSREFDLEVLRKAVRATFGRRGSTIPEEMPLAFTHEFATDSGKNTQWNAFLRKNRLEGGSLESVIERLAPFIKPLLLPKETAGQHWTPPTGWTDESPPS